MRVTVESVFYRGGSLAVGKGANEQGEDVYFGGDWREMRDIGNAIDAGEEVQIELESWQLISFEQYMAEQAQGLTDVGPYVRVAFDQKRNCDERQFRIVVYGAYNAMGLIGSECNGIVILQETPTRQVVADEIACDPGANPASRKKQVKLAAELIAMDDQAFRDFVNSQSRLRFKI